MRQWNCGCHSDTVTTQAGPVDVLARDRQAGPWRRRVLVAGGPCNAAETQQRLGCSLYVVETRGSRGPSPSKRLGYSLYVAPRVSTTRLAFADSRGQAAARRGNRCDWRRREKKRAKNLNGVLVGSAAGSQSPLHFFPVRLIQSVCVPQRPCRAGAGPSPGPRTETGSRLRRKFLRTRFSNRKLEEVKSLESSRTAVRISDADGSALQTPPLLTSSSSWGARLPLGQAHRQLSFKSAQPSQPSQPSQPHGLGGAGRARRGATARGRKRSSERSA